MKPALKHICIFHILLISVGTLAKNHLWMPSLPKPIREILITAVIIITLLIAIYYCILLIDYGAAFVDSYVKEWWAAYYVPLIFIILYLVFFFTMSTICKFKTLSDWVMFSILALLALFDIFVLVAIVADIFERKKIHKNESSSISDSNDK